MRPSWVDFHCHLDLYPDHEAVIVECDRAAVATLAVTTTPKAWPRNRELAARSEHVRVALGLHPQVVAERADEVGLVERLLGETRYVGEIGLDAGPRYYRSFADQQRVFDRILRACAEHGGKVLTIHSVRAVSNVLDSIERNLPRDRGRAVMHWFTGSAAEGRRAVELGCYFSINSEMMKSERHRTMVASLPIDRLLTETDGPFVIRGDRPVRPPDVASTVESLASVRSIDTQTMAHQVLANLSDLLR